MLLHIYTAYNLTRQYSILDIFTSQSQSHIVTDDQSVSKSWCRATSGAHDQIFITLLTVTVLFFVGCPL
jgi:hypothetical protein